MEKQVLQTDSILLITVVLKENDSYLIHHKNIFRLLFN